MNKTTSKLSFLKETSGKYYKIIFAGILAITIVHFLMQMSFIKSENLRSAKSASQSENIKPAEIAVEPERSVEQVLEAKSEEKVKPEEFEVRKIRVVTMPEKAQPVVRRQIEAAPPLQNQIRKKDVRETKAERLRRTERVLTGI